MFLISADVLSRALWSSPLPRVPELVGYSIVAIVFLQLANALRNDKLTRADAFLEHLMIRRPVAGSIYNTVFHLFGAVAFVLIAYGLIPETFEAYDEQEYFGQQGEIVVLVWPFRAIMAVCAVIMVAEFLIQAASSVRKAWLDEPDHEDARQGRPKGWGAVGSLLMVFVAGGALLFIGLDPVGIAIALIVGMLVLILVGMPIGVVMILLSFIGTWLIRDDFDRAVNLLKIASTGAIQDQLFGVVPLFVLMGVLVNIGNIGRDTFEVFQWLLQRLRGGLGIATVVANAVFAAITGVSIASAVVFTKVSVPPMLEYGYTARFSVGVVAGSSVLGMLIPPSLLLIIFGVVAEVSVGQLFNAAILPGILLALGFCLAILAMAYLVPNVVGRLRMPDTTDLPAKWIRKPPHEETLASALAKMVPITLLVIAVLGGIYGGVFTPTEAGAVGAFLALVIVCIKALVTPDLLTWRKLWKGMVDTGHISVSILFLIIGANMYSRMIALSGLPNDLIDLLLAADFGFYGTVLIYLLIVLVMGMVLDSVSIMLITLPLILPMLIAFNTDLVWFGVVAVVAVEIGLLTPPLGLTVYVVKSALGNTQVRLGDIFIGAFPFVLVMVIVTALLVAFPSLTEITRGGF